MCIFISRFDKSFHWINKFHTKNQKEIKKKCGKILSIRTYFFNEKKASNSEKMYSRYFVCYKELERDVRPISFR